MRGIDVTWKGLVVGVAFCAACTALRPPENVDQPLPSKHLVTKPPLDWNACQPESEPRNPEARGYLEEIFQRLTEANPEIFAGPYAPEKFCLAVRDQGSPEAGPGTGWILFGLDWMLSLRSDAQVAFVLAHEAAHILLDHRETTGASRQYPAEPEWDAYRDDPDCQRHEAARQEQRDNEASLRQAEYVRMDAMAQAGVELSPLLPSYRTLTLTPEQLNRFSAVEETNQDDFKYLFSDSRFIPLMEEIIAEGKNSATALVRKYQELWGVKIEQPRLEISRLEALSAQLRAKTEAIREQAVERVDACERELASLTDWEADALAFALLIRAGFDARVQTLLAADRVTDPTFETTCAGVVQKASRASKDTDRFLLHDACYRVYHLLLLEMEKYGELYAPYLQSPGTVDLPLGGLADLRNRLVGSTGPHP